MKPSVVILCSLWCVGSLVADAKPTREQLAFFETKVRPLLVEKCVRCHGPQKQRGELRLDLRNRVLEGGKRGPLVVPGQPEKSLLVQAIRYRGPKMPPKNKLSTKQIRVLTDWVRMGAPWPGDSRVSKANEDKPFVIGEADRLFWSFQPVVRPRVPKVGAWARQPIDAFVLLELLESGLSPSPEANRRELIRRVYFDVVGLPPTPEEVTAFETDEAPDAYERLVERLLASPAYGERWGRHWLDLVRYAQTNGYERDDEKPFAWRYRDYVIRAFNEDKPYDRFVLEQLAGDELANPSRDSIIATGFYRLGVWDDEPDDKVLAIWDELDDILRTTGETFLGLTIGCARCHDHKFDPIPQADYYRLTAFFRNLEPFGKDQSATHWKLNPDAVFTPLVANSDLGKKNPPTEKALSVRERGANPAPTHVLLRGNPLTPAQEVQPGFLSVLEESTPRIAPPKPDGNPYRETLARLGVKPTSGRRLALAEWIVAKDNPLTARVFANRLWHYHFGRGLVATPNDFGRTGVAPSHPELLDWLASELVDSGWSSKSLHRRILLSSTYRQSSRITNQEARRVDPGNELLWRQNMRRLDAESIRDAILAVNGRLYNKPGGRGIFPALSKSVLATQSKPGNGWGKSDERERSRRSVYIFIKRTLTVPLLDVFDQPTPDQVEPARTTTTVAPQALILLNSAFMDSNSKAFAERVRLEAVATPEQQVERAFRLALLRSPDDEECRLASSFLERRGLEALCRMVFNLNEFVYID